MKEIKFFKTDSINEAILLDAKNIAFKNDCIIRLLWTPNKYSPETSIDITSETTDEHIESYLRWAKGPWGL